MAPLPANLIRVTRPFENTGLDLALLAFTGEGKKELYLLFTYITIRAAHLEVILDICSAAFHGTQRQAACITV
ncbi:hypothetical protein T4E_12027 [Trichinella pseudospiralis]|uniref:Uncharacterized protein n=1 Tax=Trichinella pseudospiralis TaxID=6337 RepID=A0A0V0XN30_TRIPS|nr:hypothetical protein T4E_12027 [Trichinella pseudospiralis]